MNEINRCFFLSGRGTQKLGAFGLSLMFAIMVTIAGCGSNQKNDQASETQQCPVMMDASCYPRGNYMHADENTANTQAFQMCENERRNCIASEAAERAKNKKECLAADCVFSSKLEDEKCKPTWSGQPCFKMTNGLYKCSYMTETNQTSYKCDPQ